MAALLLALPGCGTVEGAGEDIEAAGDAISDTARETKQEMSK
ncbi:MAG: entericidin A/B family lipoprotein [Magnetospiraceae bacterium]